MVNTFLANSSKLNINGLVQGLNTLLSALLLHWIYCSRAPSHRYTSIGDAYLHSTLLKCLHYPFKLFCTSLAMDNLTEAKPHNHTRDDTCIQLEKCRSDMRNKATSPKGKPRQIFAEAVAEPQHDEPARLPCEKRVKRSLHYNRRDPPLPQSLRDLELPEEGCLTGGVNLEPFLICQWHRCWIPDSSLCYGAGTPKIGCSRDVDHEWNFRLGPAALHTNLRYLGAFQGCDSVRCICLHEGEQSRRVWRTLRHLHQRLWRPTTPSVSVHYVVTDF